VAGASGLELDAIVATGLGEEKVANAETPGVAPEEPSATGSVDDEPSSLVLLDPPERSAFLASLCRTASSLCRSRSSFARRSRSSLRCASEPGAASAEAGELLGA
jgi:hypothetical protein